MLDDDMWPERLTLDGLLDVMRAHGTDSDCWADLPTFGGEEPECTIGVWSWDAERLIVGDCADDVRIVTREEWADE